jgi:hypothetical protein
VRRALAFMSRDYWDGGQLDPTIQQLIQTVVPTRPFGFAIYYSMTAERLAEAGVPAAGTNATYMHPDKLLAFKQGGGVVGYYVSNAGLPTLQPSARPAAWILLDQGVPTNEIAQLQQVAPVLTSLNAALTFPNAPLSFSPGLTGMGFYDQNNRLIITVTNPASYGLNGGITLNTLASGNYVATDLFTNAQIRFPVVNGRTQFPVTLTRWDTRAFAITPA